MPVNVVKEVDLLEREINACPIHTNYFSLGEFKPKQIRTFYISF